MIARLICILSALAGFLMAGELNEERIWTGVTGKTLRGIYVRSLDDGKKVEIATTQGAIVTIALANLSSRFCIGITTNSDGRACRKISQRIKSWNGS